MGIGKKAMPYFTIWVIPSLLFTGTPVLKCVSPYYQHTLLHFMQKAKLFYINIFLLVHWRFIMPINYTKEGIWHSWSTLKTHLKKKRRRRRGKAAPLFYTMERVQFFFSSTNSIKEITHIRTQVFNMHSLRLGRDKGITWFVWLDGG